MLLNYHIGRFVLGSLCVGDLVRLGWSGVRVAGFRLKPATRTQRYTYVKRKRDRLISRQHCCYRKAINVICLECVSVALVAQHARPMSVVI